MRRSCLLRRCARPVNASAPSPHLHTVRQVLLWRAMACLLPGVLGAAALMAYQHEKSRQELELHTLQNARALVQAIDHHLLKVQAAARARARPSPFACP